MSNDRKDERQWHTTYRYRKGESKSGNSNKYTKKRRRNVRACANYKNNVSDESYYRKANVSTINGARLVDPFKRTLTSSEGCHTDTCLGKIYHNSSLPKELKTSLEENEIARKMGHSLQRQRENGREENP
jgi:hypothetical protein